MEHQQHTERILQLAEKWLDGSITAEEAQEFARWYNSFDDEKELVLDKAFAADETTLKTRMLQVLEEKTGSLNERTIPVHRVHFLRRNWLKLAAAVIVGIVLVTAIRYITTDKTDIKIEAKKTALPDVQPGGNKAVLTLANGASIVLDSAANGQLAQQGNGQVTKLADGKIAYTHAKPTAVTLLYNSLHTPRGGQYQLVLPDGTGVWLNSASSIKYPVAFAGKERAVEITGEVYFEVTKNKAMPFKVKAGNAEVTVLGTHFNINNYTDETDSKTTLLEGSVQLTSSGKVAVKLSPGEQGSIHQNDGQIQVDKNIDIAQVMAWKSGFFEFDNASIDVVMRQISRWYDVDVVYTSKPSGRYGGRFSKGLPLTQVLKFLENDMKFNIDGKRLVITANDQNK